MFLLKKALCASLYIVRSSDDRRLFLVVVVPRCCSLLENSFLPSNATKVVPCAVVDYVKSFGRGHTTVRTKHPSNLFLHKNLCGLGF